MRQIISELNVFEGDTESDNPLQKSLTTKTIINNPFEHKSGNIVLDGDIFNSFDINNVNYIHLIGNSIFSVVLDSKAVLFTRYFSLMNTETTFSIRLFPRYFGQTNIKYTTGFTNNGSGDSPIQVIGVDSIHDFDEELHNVLIELLEVDPITTQLGNNINNHSYDTILEDIIVEI